MQAYLQKHSQYIEQAARWHHLCSGGQAHKLVAVPRHRKTVITDPVCYYFANQMPTPLLSLSLPRSLAR